MDQDEILKKIFDRQETIIGDVSEIRVIQARHEENLKEHMRRSDSIETLVQINHEETEAKFVEIKPLLFWYEVAKKALALIGFVITSGSIIAAILKFVFRVL